MIDMDDLLNTLYSSFGLPILRCELQLITGKHQKRGRINIISFFEYFEAAGEKAKISPISTLSIKENENFGKSLYKKLCKLRTMETARSNFRDSVILEDPDLLGYVSRNKLQRILDVKMDLSESESALLMENLLFPDGAHKGSLDYPLLLLFLNEPIKRSTTSNTAGTALMNKMMRGNDSSALKRFLSGLFSSFAGVDPKALGVISYFSAEKILVDQCPSVDSKFLTQVLEAFQDEKSDCVQYIELVSFLSNCSIWSVMSRIQYLDQIRKKQGYDFTDFLKKYCAKKGQKIDAIKLSEQMLAIGIIMPDTGMSTIFSRFASKRGQGQGQGGNLDVQEFVNRIADVDSISAKLAPKKAEIKPLDGELNLTIYSVICTNFNAFETSLISLTVQPPRNKYIKMLFTEVNLKMCPTIVYLIYHMT